MHRKSWGISILLLSALTTIVHANETQQTVTYRLMAYNVGSAANLPLGPRQIGQIADTIIDNAADIVGLAEVEVGTSWHDGRDHVAELLVALADRGYPMQVYRWNAFQIMDGWQTPALLSRFPIEESGYEVVPPPGGYRWCVGHITVNVAENTPIRAYMTHFWPQGDDKKKNKAVSKLASLPNAYDGPSTIMGDFNLTPESNLYKIVTDQGWTSSCIAIHGKPCPSVQGMAGVSGPLPLNAQIDYIFGNDRIKFVDTYVGYFSMSDHWPIIAEVEVPANGPPIKPSLPNSTDTMHEGAIDRTIATSLYRSHNYADAAETFTRWALASDYNGDTKGFALYSAGCMNLLSNDTDTAMQTFEQVIVQFPETEWSTRAIYQTAFLLRDAKQYDKAEAAFNRFLDGYAKHIHPGDIKLSLLKIAAAEIARCRTEAGKKTPRNAVLEDLATSHPSNDVQRAAAYQLSLIADEAGDKERAGKLMAKARPTPTHLWPHEAKQVASILAAAGEMEQADRFNETFVNFFHDPIVKRVRVARWIKQHYPQRITYKANRYNPTDRTESRTITLTAGDESTSYISNPALLKQNITANITIAHNNDALLLSIRVADKTHRNKFTGNDIWQGDSVQIAIDPLADGGQPYSKDDLEFGVALGDNGEIHAAKWFDQQDRDLSQAKIAVTHTKGQTVYEIAIPKPLLWPDGKMRDKIGLNVLVNLADDAERFGYLDWTPGIGEEKAPALYPIIELAK